jgi:hypothetical protein
MCPIRNGAQNSRIITIFQKDGRDFQLKGAARGVQIVHIGMVTMFGSLHRQDG